MTTKLTLSIDDSIIGKAKKFAKSQNKSLSKLIENYLKIITLDQEKIHGNEEISPFIKSLQGSISDSENINYKKEMEKLIAEKHL